MTNEIATWREISEASRALAKRFDRDKFLKTVFKGCIKVGKSKSNPIRGNFVAAGLREAISHIIHKLSPDEDVRACVWFVQAPDTDTVTRRQRANYIIKAGLSDQFVKDILKFEVKPHADELIEMVNALNRSTHVRPNTILADGSKIRRIFSEVLDGINALLDAAEESRDFIEEAVAGAMQTAVFEKMIGEAIQELDELSTHTAIDHHWVDEIVVTDMDANTIYYEVTGSVVVELQYGSGSDVANDIGSRDTDEYPYEAEIELPISDPLTVTASDVRVKVGTSSFYK